jgi:thymidine kinase
MFSGKSDSLITKYKQIWNKNIVIAFKPKIDARDKDVIKSKNWDIEIPAICINDLSEIPQYVIDKNIHTVFIDEAQFLTGDVNILTELSVLYDIDFYIAGLNMTSEQEPFMLMPQILAVSNNIEVIKGFCVECNKESMYTYLEGGKTEQVKTGDDGYTSLCPSCLKKKILSRKKVRNNER